jgi:HAD superfamily hydrolase (TIGR01490 family)
LQSSPETLLHSSLNGKLLWHYGEMMIKLAIYDLDKTITRRATFLPFLRYAVPRLAPWRVLLVPLMLGPLTAYGFKQIDRGRLKELNLQLMLGSRMNGPRLAAVARGFAGRTLSGNVLRGALDQIAADKAAGARVVIASASCAFYVAEIGKLLGINEAIGTRLVSASGDILPKIVGENCYGPAKLRMIEAWLSDQGITRADAEIRFYSDHVTDAPCLEWADEAFATNAHPPLRALASERGWTCYDWQHPARHSRERGNPALPQ